MLDVLGHLFISVLFLLAAGFGYLLWAWELDEAFPMPVRIFGVALAIAAVIAAVTSWWWA